MSRSYQQYIDDIIYEIERVIDNKKRSRNNLRHCFWAELSGSTSTPATSHGAAKIRKIETQAEIHKHPSHPGPNALTEVVTMKAEGAPTSSKKKQLNDRAANDFDSIETISYASRSTEENPEEINNEIEVLPCRKFIIGGDETSTEGDEFEGEAPGNNFYLQEEPQNRMLDMEMEVLPRCKFIIGGDETPTEGDEFEEEAPVNNFNLQEEPQNRMLDICVLFTLALILIGLFAGSIYQAMASQN